MRKVFVLVLLLSCQAQATFVSVNGGSGGGGGSGNVTDINGDVTASVTLSVGTTGSDFNIADDAAGGHVFHLPDAGASARGAVTTGAQTFAGVKTLSSAPVLSALTASLPICTSSGKATSSTCAGLIPWADIVTGNNYRLIATGAAGVPAEAAAITASKGLCSDANGIPVACASGPSTVEMARVTGVSSGIQSQLDGKQATMSDADVTGKVLTGFSSGAGTVASTDTILQAFNKLWGWIVSLKVDSIDGFIESPTDKAYTLIEYAKFAGTINDVTFKTVSGTATAALKITGTNVTSCNAVSITSTQGTTSCTAANAWVAGDRVTMTLSSSSAPVDLAFSVKYTR